MKFIKLADPNIGAKEAKQVALVIKSGWIGSGPKVKEFEKDFGNYKKSKNVTAVSSCTAALHLALKLLGVKEGDHVFCSDLTFIASANAILYLGAIPIFIDSEELSWNMCPNSLELAFKNHCPKAVVVTDLYGQSAKYSEISAICNLQNVPIIEDAGYEIGKNYFIGYSPEREDPGNKNFTTKTIPKVVSGYTKNCLNLIKTLYDAIVDSTVSVSSTRAAEMTKILENIHRAVNIGLVNELKMVMDKMDIDIYEVINASSTKPFGFTPYYPGPGLGGHCIPIDPFYLTWKAKQYGIATRFIELAGHINGGMPRHVVQQISDALNSQSKAINGSVVHLFGVAYKPGVSDTRESPALDILKLLLERGAVVRYTDPFVGVVTTGDLTLEAMTLEEALAGGIDCAVITTAHAQIDYAEIARRVPVVVDTRNALKRVKAGHVFRL